MYPGNNGEMDTNEGLQRAGRAVIARREARGLSQLALARKAGIDPKTLRALETGTRWPQGKNRAAVERALGWRLGALEAIREGLDAALSVENPHSADAIIAGVVEDLGLDDNSPATLRALRRDLEEREIESLPERVAALTHESKVKVNTLVTQLEDEEYEAVASRIPVERRVEIEMLADPESSLRFGGDEVSQM